METITSRKNLKVQELKKLGASRAYRRERGLVLCDGAKLLREAELAGLELGDVFICDGEDVDPPFGAGVFRVSESLLEYISPLKNPQPVLFTCAMPSLSGSVPDGGAVLVLENVQDPGNVGTAIRTANAFGIGAVILLGACADPFNPKTLRASMGAVFRQRIVECRPDELRGVTGGRKLIGAALGGYCRDIRELELRDTAVCIGSEGRGLSNELLDMCDARVNIPRAAGSESLNAAAAAAVLMWHMRAQEI
ncbi:MAG: RNA methyltransferase [Oscillospiraceae bacterium]|nr:RNA methyltransferase [Oscillospiraceae bacterium]